MGHFVGPHADARLLPACGGRRASRRRGAARTVGSGTGVPAEPTDAEAAVEAVKASMARVEEQDAAGIGATYVIEFGDTFDWVRMVSGEWLKGEMKRMRDDNLEFDSDKLDMQNIDFADVSQSSSRPSMAPRRFLAASSSRLSRAVNAKKIGGR
ncbi:MAG: hypothetical protein JRG70_10145 [Deltaproteobacteria bacterium]|nr:hypothetical protein [Deltaproteobacteria bacterium]